MGTDYVVSMYPPPPRTIHPPHRNPRNLEESVIVLRRHYDNIVSLVYYYGIIRSSPFGGEGWRRVKPPDHY